MQNVSDAPPDTNVQHVLSVGSVQSALTWHSCTFVVLVHVVPRCVGHAAAVVHDVPSDIALHDGNVPVPSGMSMPQHTGVAPLQSEGPSHASLSAAAQLASATHAKVGGLPGVVQHTSVTRHAEPPAQPKSYMPTSIERLSTAVEPDEPHAARTTTNERRVFMYRQ